jgi:hypothetical protein
MYVLKTQLCPLSTGHHFLGSMLGISFSNIKQFKLAVWHMFRT